MGDVLNLDELFGQNKAIKVKWGTKEYDLLATNSIGPRDLVRWQKLIGKVEKLQDLDTDEMTDEQADELESTINSALKLIGPDLPIGELSFMAKVRILEFYNVQNGFVAEDEESEGDDPKV